MVSAHSGCCRASPIAACRRASGERSSCETSCSSRRWPSTIKRSRSAVRSNASPPGRRARRGGDPCRRQCAVRGCRGRPPRTPAQVADRLRDVPGEQRGKQQARDHAAGDRLEREHAGAWPAAFARPSRSAGPSEFRRPAGSARSRRPNRDGGVDEEDVAATVGECHATHATALGLGGVIRAAGSGRQGRIARPRTSRPAGSTA